MAWRGGLEGYKNFARRWHDDAMAGRYWLFTGNDVTHKATHQVDTYLTTNPKPPAGGIAVIVAELQAARLDMAAAMAAMERTKSRLATAAQLLNEVTLL